MKHIHLTRGDKSRYFIEEKITCHHCKKSLNFMIVINRWRPKGKYERFYFCPKKCIDEAGKKYALFSTPSQIISIFSIQSVKELPEDTKPFAHQLTPTFVSGSMNAFDFATRNPPGTNHDVKIDDQTRLAGRETFGHYNHSIKEMNRRVQIGKPEREVSTTNDNHMLTVELDEQLLRLQADSNRAIQEDKEKEKKLLTEQNNKDERLKKILASRKKRELLEVKK